MLGRWVTAATERHKKTEKRKERGRGTIIDRRAKADGPFGFFKKKMKSSSSRRNAKLVKQ